MNFDYIFKSLGFLTTLHVQENHDVTGVTICDFLVEYMSFVYFTNNEVG